MANKIWITAAMTGGIHTPTMSPYLPVTTQQIIDDAVGAYDAGAAVVHIHARFPDDGKPTSDINRIREIVAGIKKRCDVIICITTGGALGMTLEERLAPIPDLRPELASLNSGSINFVLAPAANAVKKLGAKHAWEVPYLESTSDFVFSNTFRALEKYTVTMNDVNTRPEFEVYDVGMINNIAHFIKTGVVRTPPYIQFVMGILGGIPATADNLVHLVRTAKEQIKEFHWSVAAAGRFQFPMAAVAMAMGGNVRVGLEDNLYLRPGQLAKSSAEQVLQAREMMKMLGLELASANEVRATMGLKGKDQVGF